MTSAAAARLAVINEKSQAALSKALATIEQLGGAMPEDEPALEHIREAEKRLKAAQPKEPKALLSSPSVCTGQALRLASA